jgi:hypothetical protein
MGLTKRHLAIEDEVIDYSLKGLMELLGSPAKLKTAWAELKAISDKADKARKALAKAEAERKDEVFRDASARQTERDAILKDQTALAAAWARFDETQAAQNKSAETHREAVRVDTRAQGAEKARLAKDQEDVKKARQAVAAQVTRLNRENDELRAAAEQARQDKIEAEDALKVVQAGVNARMHDMRKALS